MVKMLTLPTTVGLIWLILSFVCLFTIPFIILFYTIKRRYKLFKIILIQTLCWISVFAFIYFVFGGIWFFIGIIGPTLTMG